MAQKKQTPTLKVPANAQFYTCSIFFRETQNLKLGEIIVKKYTYIFKSEGMTFSQQFINDIGLEKNIDNAKAIAKRNGWKVHAVNER